MDILAANSEFGIPGKFRTSTFQSFASLYDWANEGFYSIWSFLAERGSNFASQTYRKARIKKIKEMRKEYREAKRQFLSEYHAARRESLAKRRKALDEIHQFEKTVKEGFSPIVEKTDVSLHARSGTHPTMKFILRKPLGLKLVLQLCF
jgi:hypothetical protein